MITMLIIGVGLGFILEGAGFANPRKLTGVFVLKDFSVPIVMGSAIIAAMAGLLVLTLVGVDTERFFVAKTAYLAQAIGGLIFGIGFFLGGYCPGTSVAAAGSGRLDAWAFMAGLVGGYYLWGPLRGWIQERFPDFLDRSRETLPGVLGVDHRIVAGAFVVGGGAFLVWLFLKLRRPQAA